MPTTPRPAPPDLTRYRLIHRALRTTDDRLVAALAATAPTDLDRARALGAWFADYLGELTHHHAVEDEIFFPALAARVPSHAHLAPALDADHHRVDGLLAALGAAVARWTGGGPAEVAHGEAVALATELRDLLDAHLDVEDADVLPLFERHFSAAEYDAMDQAALKSLPFAQLRFTVPWLVDALDAEDAATLLAGAPTPLKLLWRATRRGYGRRRERALGPVPAPTARPRRAA